MNNPIQPLKQDALTQLEAFYNNACISLEKAKNTLEVKELRNKADAIRVYSKQAKNKQLEIDATEIRLKAERKIGELMQKQRDAGLMNNGAQGNPNGQGAKLVRGEKYPAQTTLAENGIDKNLAKRARKLYRVPPKEFEKTITDWRNRVEQDQERVSLDILKEHKPKKHHYNNENNHFEWYTPENYIETARRVLGEIDLDPSSCKLANQTVQAKTFFSLENNGLKQAWFGNVWLNPPYEYPLIAQFSEKLLSEFLSGHIQNAIVLVNNCTETQWFQKLAQHAQALFFNAGRIHFVQQDNTTQDGVSPAKNSALQGQAFFLFSNEPSTIEAFNREFTSRHSGFIGLLNRF